MKNRIFYKIVTLVIFSLVCTNQSSAETEENKKILEEIQTQILNDSGMFHSLSLKFNEDNTYLFEYGSEGIYWFNLGTFSLVDNYLKLKPTVCKERQNNKNSIPCNESFGIGKCKIQDSNQDVLYEKFLVCTSQSNSNAFGLGKKTNEFSFGLTNYLTKSGKIIKYQNIEILILKKDGITLSNVKIRELPNIQSKALHHYLDYENGKYLEFVPKNTKIFLLGRTTSVAKIQNWSNYWYLVNVDDSHYVWMFGEFIKMDE